MPSSGFVMQPHEDPLPPLGFLDFEQRGQFEARQAIVLGVAGECRCSRIVLGSLVGSLVSAVEDGGFHFLDGGSDVRFPEQLVAHPLSTRAGPKLRRPESPELRYRAQGSHGQIVAFWRSTQAQDGGVGLAETSAGEAGLPFAEAGQIAWIDYAGDGQQIEFVEYVDATGQRVQRRKIKAELLGVIFPCWKVHLVRDAIELPALQRDFSAQDFGPDFG